MSEGKLCRKCLTAYPADTQHFYRSCGGKCGLTPRCKTCVDEDNKLSHAKRLAAMPEKVRAQANARTKKSYHKNLSANRERQRQHQAKRRQDPDELLKIQTRKRVGGAGLSPDQLEALFQAQGTRCAICAATEPGSKNGWNVDHCHKTKRVRFVLCAHCNRGLGAFKDNTSIMRKAADMLDTFYQNQADKPVEGILE